jgi:hypothetical protein
LTHAFMRASPRCLKQARTYLCSLSHAANTPRMPTWSSTADDGGAPAWSDEDGLAAELAALRLRERGARYRAGSRDGSAPAFAGGFFNPREKPLPPAPFGHQAAFTAPRHAPPGGFTPDAPQWPMPMPMTMAMPAPAFESRTMQYARNDGPLGFASPPPLPPPLSSRRRSAPTVPRVQAAPTNDVLEIDDSDVGESISVSSHRQRRPSPPSPTLLRPPTLPARPQSDSAVTPSTPKRKGRSASISTPNTPGSPGATEAVQCNGTTQAGGRCKRKVRAAAPLGDRLSGDDEPLERFCPQHAEQIAKDSTFFIKHKQGAYADYIPAYLSEQTRVALRLEMHRAPSAADKPGYLYTFQIMDAAVPPRVHLKVGRTSNVGRRINQWGKQCGSHEQILRGFWPGTVDADADGGDGDGVDLIKGRIKAGTPGSFAAKLERLVHLELADLVAHAPYQETGWPDELARPMSPSGTPKKGTKLVRTTCDDCKSSPCQLYVTMANTVFLRWSSTQGDLLLPGRAALQVQAPRMGSHREASDREVGQIYRGLLRLRRFGRCVGALLLLLYVELLLCSCTICTICMSTYLHLSPQVHTKTSAITDRHTLTFASCRLSSSWP